MKRWIVLMLAVCLVWTLAGCHKEEPVATTQPTTEPATQPTTEPATEPVQPKAQVALCLPEQTPQWENCAKQLRSRLKEQGCEVQTFYAEGSAQEQAKQLQSLIGQKTDLLVVASVDAHTLDAELDSAAEAGVKVVTLDRQVLHARGVSATVTFDYVNLGVSMGNQIAEAKQLATAKEESRSHTIEFFMGSADDQNAVLIHRGIMAVLQPYLDSGVLVSKTGRVTLEDTYVQGWDAQLAQTKLSQYLEIYGETVPDILCCASDELAAGAMAALPQTENWPVITSIGGSNTAIRNILEGKQAYTVYRDTVMLYENCSRIVRCLLEGEPLPKQDNMVAGNPGEATVYVCPGVQVNGVAGIRNLLDYGLSVKQLDLTDEDVTRILSQSE